MLTHTVMAVDVGQLMADAGMTILIGLVVVFSVLILLTFIFWLFGKIAGGSSKKTTAPKTAAAEPAAKPAPAPRPIPPTVQAGISEEIVAVIAAAVAAMEPDGSVTLCVVSAAPVLNGLSGVWQVYPRIPGLFKHSFIKNGKD